MSQPPPFFSLTGRLRRRTYFLQILSLTVPAAFLNQILAASDEPAGVALGALLLLAAGTLTIFPAVKRLHDLDKSGHWLWISLVPLINLGLGLALLFMRGTRGSNKYGPDPREDEAPQARKKRSSPETKQSDKATSVADASPSMQRATQQPGSKDGAALSNKDQEGKQNGKTQQRTKSAPPPRPPTPTVKRVQIQPVNFKDWPDAYPFVAMTKTDTMVRPPRKDRSGSRGFKEEDFEAYLKRYVGEDFQVVSDYALATTARTRSYEPDLTLHHPDYNLYVDIEIDEPYAGLSRMPTHCQDDDNDKIRDRAFTSLGWVVIRFAEIQVHQTPEACCRFITELLTRMLPNYEIPEALRHSKTPQRVDFWTKLEAQEWSREKYRENYLDIDGFGEEEQADALFIEELTAEEEAVEPKLFDLPTGGDGEDPNASGDGQVSANARDEVAPDRAASPNEADFPGEATRVRSQTTAQVQEDATKLLLEEQNSHPRDRHLSFDEEAHRYFIRGNPDTRSVTDLIEGFFPIFNAARVAEKVANKPSSKYFGRDPLEIIQGWNEKGEKAMRRGSALHNAIEQYLNGQPVEEKTQEFGFFKRFLREHSELDPYRTEWRIYDERLMIAGTLDALFKRPNGDLVMYDWKRTKALKRENKWESGLGPLSHLPNANYWKYAIQQNIYREILRVRYDLDVAEMNLLVLHPSNDSYELHPIEPMPKETTALLKS